MINIYKNKSDIDDKDRLIELNDVFFNKFTSALIDNKAKEYITKIDGAVLVSKYKIKSKFGDMIIDIDKLSSGCKTVLNILYNPDKIFSINECGDNALEIVYSLDKGNVYSEYAMIPFDMKEVNIITKSGQIKINDYDELKEWWNNEN